MLGGLKARRPMLCAALALAAGCAKTPEVAAPARAHDPVVARVNGDAILGSDVTRELTARGLDPAASPPGSASYAGMIDQLVDRKLLAAAAVTEGLDRTADGRRRLEAARQRVLGDLLLDETLRGAVSEAAVQGLYQEMIKAKPPGAPPETLAEARPRIVRFLTFDRVKDEVLVLRHKARIEIAAPSQIVPRKP